jgi:hypothetical protein
MDEDLESMSRDELIDEIKRLRAGIRKDRDDEGHELCWYRPELWSLLPESKNKVFRLPMIPPWPEFMTKCAEFRASLDK